ncbi:MAG: DUF3782 domain-containing protein [Blastocatellia bacterium]
MTDQELKDLVASLSGFSEQSKREQAELREAQRETDRQIKQVSKQIGEIGNKFGSFTEGMAYPSMRNVLESEFGMEIVLPNASSKKNGRTLEIDVLAYDKVGRNEAAIVEVKSHLTEAGIEQILKTIKEFPTFFPDLADRTVYGILAAVKIPENMRIKVAKIGLYLAVISDETFKLQVPAGFKPKAFGGNGQKTNGSKRTKKSK